MGLWELGGVSRLLLIAAALVVLLGVQLPTATINIPLNNQIKTLDPDSMDAATCRRAREAFESRWNRWNVIRTVCASLASLVLMLLLMTV